MDKIKMCSIDEMRCFGNDDSKTIYFISTTDSIGGQKVVKIGVSGNVTERLKSLQSTTPFALGLWYSFDVDEKRAFEIEGYLHYKFREDHYHGEWFIKSSGVDTFVECHKNEMLKFKNNYLQNTKKRKLFGIEIDSIVMNKFLCATSLVKAGNRKRMVDGKAPFRLDSWLNQKGTKEFIEELNKKYGKVKTKYGRNTWFHPLLFIDLALAIDPKFKVEVYGWLFDLLIKNRNVSGDSYKQMCGNLYTRHRNKRSFPEFIKNVAGKIRLKCNVVDWQEATEDQLRLRDKIHNEIALLSDVLNNNDEAVRIALLRN